MLSRYRFRPTEWPDIVYRVQHFKSPFVSLGGSKVESVALSLPMREAAVVNCVFYIVYVVCMPIHVPFSSTVTNDID